MDTDGKVNEKHKDSRDFSIKKFEVISEVGEYKLYVEQPQDGKNINKEIEKMRSFSKPTNKTADKEED